MISASSSREQIFSAVATALQELFEIPASEVREAATLFDELDLDSLDAADMRAHIQDQTGRTVPEAEFQDVRTVGDVVALIQKVVSAG